MARIEAAGGRVINWNGYRVLGVLATSRSIGIFALNVNLFTPFFFESVIRICDKIIFATIIYSEKLRLEFV